MYLQREKSGGIHVLVYLGAENAAAPQAPRTKLDLPPPSILGISYIREVLFWSYAFCGRPKSVSNGNECKTCTRTHVEVSACSVHASCRRAMDIHSLKLLIMNGHTVQGPIRTSARLSHSSPPICKHMHACMYKPLNPTNLQTHACMYV